jgi:hypothetical protein
MMRGWFCWALTTPNEETQDGAFEDGEINVLRRAGARRRQRSSDIAEGERCGLAEDRGIEPNR